jgi:DNA-binding transcriptional LysR family regulator
MEIGSIGTIKALVERGLGYTVVSALAVAGELARGSLSLLAVEGLPIGRELRLVSRPCAAGVGEFAGYVGTSRGISSNF